VTPRSCRLHHLSKDSSRREGLEEGEGYKTRIIKYWGKGFRQLSSLFLPPSLPSSLPLPRSYSSDCQERKYASHKTRRVVLVTGVRKDEEGGAEEHEGET